ncbi:YueI family protein [Jeotgalibacillus aurantiacus]|uniref:YueI family protein n=1 Tax=Jeotgalibacillus aurantiacus TaxID=2763266 RepID=UPI001D0B1EDB|nr:YueI family protein [Jeotgalibacillus aurantiacus]
MAQGKRNVDDYLQEGIYGARETLPDERRMYLTSIRERIEYALYQNQIRESEVYPEIEEAMKKYKELKLFLNGNMSYRFISKYIQLADRHGVSYQVVTNREHNSEYGLILSHPDAVDKETITLPKRSADNGAAPTFWERLFK